MSDLFPLSSGPTPLPLQRPAGEPLRGGWVESYEDELGGGRDSETLLHYWELLRRRRAMVLLFAVLGAVAGISLSLPRAPSFRAEAKLEIQGGGENLTALGEINAAPGSRYLSEFEIATQVEMLFDKYRQHRYGAIRSRDLKQWEDITDQVSMPEGARHGTVFRAPRSVVAQIQSH